MPPLSRASTRRQTHGVTNALSADQAPERALRRRAAAGVADIGDHEGHVGDVAGAEQKIAGEIDQHRPDARIVAGAAVGDAGRRIDRRQQQRNRHGDREQRHRPPDDPPRSRPESLQHERRDQAGRQDAEPGPGVKQAEQEVRPRRAAIARWSPPARRRRRKPTAAPSPTSSRAKLRTTKLPDSAHSASDTTQASVPQRTAADSPKRLHEFRGDQRAGEIAGRIDGVHEARGGIRPAERIAHVRQHQRIGEAADAEPDGGRQRQDQDQPRGMRRRRGDGRGLSRGCSGGACTVAGSGAIAQARRGNGVLPIAQCRFSNPRAAIIPARQRDRASHLDGRLPIASPDASRHDVYDDRGTNHGDP